MNAKPNPALKRSADKADPKKSRALPQSSIAETLAAFVARARARGHSRRGSHASAASHAGCRWHRRRRYALRSRASRADCRARTGRCRQRAGVRLPGAARHARCSDGQRLSLPRPRLRRHACGRHHSSYGEHSACRSLCCRARRRVGQGHGHRIRAGRRSRRAHRVGRPQRLPPSRLSSHRDGGRLRLCTRRRPSARPQRERAGDGAGHRALDGIRLDRIRRGWSVEQAAASGLGGAGRHYRGGARPRRLLRRHQPLRRALRPLQFLHGHAIGSKRT